MQDLRYGGRMLLRTPGFALVSILTLAIGIGANTAIFSVVNGVLLRPLPVSRLRNGSSMSGPRRAATERDNHSAADFLDISRENQSLSGIAGWRSDFFTLAGRHAEPARLEGTYVTVEFFDVLGTTPAAGRLFSRGTDDPASGNLVVLGDEAWRQLFDRGIDAVGAQVRVDGVAHTVVGVLPRRTEFPEGSKVWVLSTKPVPPSPLATTEPGADRDVRYFAAIARLKPGVSLRQAQSDLDRVAAAIAGRHPQTAAGRTLRIAPIYDDMVDGVRRGLVVLQCAVGLVLLVACANVSSLLIARAAGRRRELAIRAALGAGRLRLARQLLSESLLLGAAGGLAGLLLATWLVGAIAAVLPASVPRTSEIGIDPIVAAVALTVALLAAGVFGVIPSMHASRADPASALKSGGDRGGSIRTRGRGSLVIAQVALTLILLSGAGLLLNSFLRLRGVDSGMQPEHVTVLDLVLPSSRYATEASQAAAYRRLLELVSAQSAMQAVAVGFPGPLRGSNASGSFVIDGRPSTDQSDQPHSSIGSVSGSFFTAIGIPLLQGRTFDERDGATAAPVAIANVTLARTYWPGASPVGKRVRFDPQSPWITIVGMVGDVHQYGLDKAPPPILYIPYGQFPVPFTNVVVRSTAPPGTVAGILRNAVAAVDPELPADEITTLQSVLDRSVEEPRFRATLIGAFAIAALLLAAVGVYGLMSHSVTERTREIGIRVALGAQPWQVLGGIMREGLVLALAGIAIGLAGALLAVRVIASFLYGVAATDPLTLGVGRRAPADRRPRRQLHSVPSRPARRSDCRPARRLTAAATLSAAALRLVPCALSP